MSDLWNAVTDLLGSGLEGLHNGLAHVFGGDAAWGWAIIALTVIIRVLLLPLAIKQTRSMRAMQALQPKIKSIQKKYKADKDLLKKDPQKYRERRQKMNEEMMALYQEHGVNPASGCLPMLPQIPIFIALFSVLKSHDFGGASASFYFFTDHISSEVEQGLRGLGANVSQAGWPGWLLVIFMAATMFLTQRQMLARNPAAEGSQTQQQKIMMYVMPVFLAFVSQGLPLGVLLYWVTTNVWQAGQQYVVLKEVEHHPEGPGADGDARTARKRGASGGGGKRRSSPRSTDGGSRGDRSTKPKADGRSSGGRNRNARPDHLPRRRGGSGQGS